MINLKDPTTNVQIQEQLFIDKLFFMYVSAVGTLPSFGSMSSI